MQKEEIKDYLKQYYIAPIIVEIFVLVATFFVFQPNYDNQNTKDEIEYHFGQANNFSTVINLKKQLMNTITF